MSRAARAPATGAVDQMPVRSPRQMNGTPVDGVVEQAPAAAEGEQPGQAAEREDAAERERPAAAARGDGGEGRGPDEGVAHDQRDTPIGGLAGGVERAEVEHGADCPVRHKRGLSFRCKPRSVSGPMCRTTGGMRLRPLTDPDEIELRARDIVIGGALGIGDRGGDRRVPRCSRPRAGTAGC